MTIAMCVWGDLFPQMFCRVSSEASLSMWKLGLTRGSNRGRMMVDEAIAEQLSIDSGLNLQLEDEPVVPTMTYRY